MTCQGGRKGKALNKGGMMLQAIGINGGGSISVRKCHDMSGSWLNA